MKQPIVWFKVHKTAGTTLKVALMGRDAPLCEGSVWRTWEIGEGQFYQTAWTGRVPAPHNPDKVIALDLQTKDGFVEEEPELYERAWKFTLVRNPFDRLISGFEDMRHRPDGLPSDLPFDDFVATLDRDFGAPWHPIGAQPIPPGWSTYIHCMVPQAEFLKIKGERPPDLHVLLYERLEEDLELLWERIGLKLKLAHMHRSVGRRPYRDYYSDWSRRKVEEYFAADFELGDYTF